MYQTSLNLVPGSEFIEPTAGRKLLKTKTAVIQEAAKILNSYHPNKKASAERYNTLKATFIWLCHDIREDQPEASAFMIFKYVTDTLALRAT